MGVRPQIDEETVERVNKKVGPLMRVDAEDAGFDTKVNILLDELNKAERRSRENSNQVGGTQGPNSSRRF